MLLAASPIAAAKTSSRPDPVDAQAWAVLDPADGELLGSFAGKEQRQVASATKMMTALVALERLEPADEVTAEGYQPESTLESLAGLEAGDTLSAEDMLYALLLASANDAAVELARESSGSVSRFVGQMNRKASGLGLEQTSFTNPIGLDDEGNYSSAEDLTRLAAALLSDPLGARIADTESRTLRSGDEPIEIENRNPLLGQVPWVNGVKTGQTLGAGWVLVASGSRDGVDLIAVVLGASSEAARNESAIDLLRWGFAQYAERNLVSAGQLEAKAKVAGGEGAVLELEAARGLVARLRKDTEVVTRVEAPEVVEGPIERGEELGRITAFAGEHRVGAVPLIAARAVDAPSLAEKTSPLMAVVLIAVGLLVILAGVAGVRSRRGDETSE